MSEQERRGDAEERQGRGKASRVPPMKDPIWAEWTKGVLRFLDHPRDWIAIARWCRDHMTQDKFRHCIAWLEEQGLAYSFVLNDVTYWVGTQARKRSLTSDEPERDPLGG